MIKSMTAFARHESCGAWGTCACEIRSVNHRFLDINLRLPEELRCIEAEIRDLTRSQLTRGKVDIVLRFQQVIDDNALPVNQRLIQQLVNTSQSLAQQIGSSATINVTSLLSWPGVLEPLTQVSEAAQTQVLELIKNTLNDLQMMRAREGQALSTLLSDRLSQIKKAVDLIRPYQASMIEEQKTKLLAKISGLKLEADVGRLEQELVYWAQKTDISEELDRLETHVTQVQQCLAQDEAVGRRLDFLFQEINREANTLGSKSVNTKTSQAAIDIKVLVEQLREQVQNIE